MDKYIQALRLRSWRTAGARYNASRRWKRREVFATASLALFSSLSIAVAFIQHIYSAPSGSAIETYLTAFSATLGVFILAISLIEWGSGASVKSEALYRNAEELNSFQGKLELRLAKLESPSSTNPETTDGILSEYTSIKDRCPYNHEPIDDLRFQVQHYSAPEFTDQEKSALGLIKRNWVKFVWFISGIWHFLILWLAVACAVRVGLTLV